MPMCCNRFARGDAAIATGTWISAAATATRCCVQMVVASNPATTALGAMVPVSGAIPTIGRGRQTEPTDQPVKTSAPIGPVAAIASLITPAPIRDPAADAMARSHISIAAGLKTSAACVVTPVSAGAAVVADFMLAVVAVAAADSTLAAAVAVVVSMAAVAAVAQIGSAVMIQHFRPC